MNPNSAVSGDPLSLERIHADPPLVGVATNSITFSGDGAAVAWLRGSDTDSEVHDLWILRPGQSQPAPLVRTRDLADVAALRVSEEERAANERLRLHHGGITSFAWCGPDARRVVFPLSSDLYLASTEPQGAVERLTRDSIPKLDPRCSPSGTFVSFVRAGEVFVIDLATKQERKLTSGATETVSNGLAEFVAQEEMDRHRGYFWSHDDTWIASLQVDVSAVSTKVRPRIHADRTELHSQRYPAAGEPNAQVRVQVGNVTSGSTVEVALPAEDGYVARVDWSPDQARLWVQWQSRDQKRLLLFEALAPDFQPVPVLTETDDAWVELSDDFTPLAGGDAFLWTSERTGRRQIWMYERLDGVWQPRQVTDGPDPVAAIKAVDLRGKRLFFSKYTDRGRQLHVFSAPLEGGQASRVTGETGWHDTVFSPRGLKFVDVLSTFTAPPKVELRDGVGSVVAMVDANPADDLTCAAASAPQWVDVPAEDGSLLNGVLIPPVGVVPGKRYPVIVQVYAGPGGSLATQRFLRQRPFHVFLGQRGFGTFILDGRGTAHRGRAFARAIHGRVGDVEIADQIRGARWLATQPWVDPDRIGIWGWSYGGYASLMAILREDTPFRSAAAIAPVTDWRLYDTHYTERYLGLPQEQKAAYDRADVLGRAGKLHRPLLLVHGMADDNVLFEHSLRLMERLQQGGTPFELMVYPGRAHGLDGRMTQLHLFHTLTAFFERTLASRKE